MHTHSIGLAMLAACLSADAATCVSPASLETQPVYDLVKRVTPAFANRVRFTISKNCPSATISKGEGETVLISAPDTREAIRAYGYYLRHIAHVHFSWNGDNAVLEKLPLPERNIEIPAKLPYNLAFNYCTISYSGAHWDRRRWEREIDMLALNGFDHVLVTTGLEKVWQNVLRELGYPEKQIAAYIPNPAYAAWWHMGNLEGTGGPLSQSLIDGEAKLGKFIVRRLRELGLEPVLQGYVGFLPHDFPQEKINGVILPQGAWCGFQRPAVLSPVSPDFPRVASVWYKHLHAQYGVAADYGGDLFHEGGKKGDTPLKEAAQAVQQAMQTASPGSKWLIQAWGHNPSPQLLEGCNPSQTIILALEKNMDAASQKKRQYGQFPHVWCELANFGGKQGLYGGFPLLENLTGNAGNAIGLGMLSEGVETNPFYYELFFQRINNRDKIDRGTFIREYIKNRYGAEGTTAAEKAIQAFSMLAESVYSPYYLREGCTENILCASPSLTAEKVSTWSSPHVYYDPGVVKQAALLLLQAGQEDPAMAKKGTYRYDLADACRQVLADQAREKLLACREAYEGRKKELFIKRKNEFLNLIRHSAQVLSTSRHFLLGVYLRGAAAKASTAKDREALTRGIKSLITTWTPDKVGILNDYGHRQYAELMSGYYLKRWDAFFNTCIRELNGQATEKGITTTQSNENNGEKVVYKHKRNKDVEAIELHFPTSDTPLLTKPQGNIMELAQKLLNN